MSKFFNFNNEEYQLPIEVTEDGRVTVEINNAPVEFANVTELAHAYAVARNVSPDNLKNWTLVEDGETYSFVLRAATAGVDFFADDFEEQDEELSWNEYEDEDEYDYDELFSDRFSTNELKALQTIWDMDNVNAVIERVNALDEEQQDALYERLQHVVRNATELGETTGGFNIGLQIFHLGNKIHSGEVPENQTAEANKLLATAAFARRENLHVVRVNVTDGRTCSANRRTDRPFTTRELVRVVENRVIVFER